MTGLKCECGKELKRICIGFTGCDWSVKAGEGSGYDWEVALVCECGRNYHIGSTKGINDFSPNKELKEC